MSESTTSPAAPEVPPAPDTQPAPVAPAEEQPARPPRRALRAFGRWTATVAVFAVLGGGIGYGLTVPERTDLPGLATQDDGRWDYPELSLPALPPGSFPPFDKRNHGETHDVDLRDLLLPAPRGAKAGKDLPSPKGDWIAVQDFLAIYEKDDRADLRERLRDDAVRHIAARGWTMPDGTETRVYLLQFNSSAFVNGFYTQAIAGGLEPTVSLTDAPKAKVDESWPDTANVQHVLRYSFDEAKPYGEARVRQAYLTAGDVLALVVQERDGTPPEVPWHQTVTLQSQLLG